VSARVRPYRLADAPALLELFRGAVRRVNARDYSPEQVAAWASDAIDPAGWAARFEGRFAVVAEDEHGRHAGFAELEPDGRIDRFYVSADHQRRGVGCALLMAIESEAARRGLSSLRVEASLTARPFFAARGFAEEAEQVVALRGVSFVNVRMSKNMPGDPSRSAI
jgi:putative acetyltransferase